MIIFKWKIGYIKDGVKSHQIIWWQGRPTENEAATVIKVRVLPEQGFLTEIDPLEPNKIVALLRKHGIEIVEIELADTEIDATARRILVVDDNADGRQSLVKVLKMWGHTVEEAADGQACLAKASTFIPDVILLDIGLPRMNGYEVAKQLRKLPQLSATRIIAVTGYGTHSDIKRAVDAGFDEHFTKPVALDELRERLFTKTTISH